MICNDEIRVAKCVDAVFIAEMSRDIVESGLGWSWTPSHVIEEINSKNSNVIVTLKGNIVIGFAVMNYQSFRWLSAPLKAASLMSKETRISRGMERVRPGTGPKAGLEYDANWLWHSGHPRSP